MSVLNDFVSIIRGNLKGKGEGVYSICSAHRDVIIAGMKLAKEKDTLILIESTSNQVNQMGGYTHMVPQDFVEYINKIAKDVDFPTSRILLGGDHLGPNAWKDLPSEKAMSHACDLVRAYVKAGYQKIHLDASMHCLDDAKDTDKAVWDTIVAQRSAMLCEIAEQAWKEMGSDKEKPVYVIGTEVPIPGGAQQEEDGVIPTLSSDAALTIKVTKEAFLERGLDDAFKRVVALVVQPGVEFGDDQVFQYNRDAALPLIKLIESGSGLVYESHSTDYQSETSLKALVQDHFCILKVGPWLTFAYREALFALESIEKELLHTRDIQLSGLVETLEHVMLEQPKYWKPYYGGDAIQQCLKRKYSFSDRSRYYWPDSRLKDAVNRLENNLNNIAIPLTLISQYMPNQYTAVQEGRIRARVDELIIDHIQDVMRIYSAACGQ